MKRNRNEANGFEMWVRRKKYKFNARFRGSMVMQIYLMIHFSGGLYGS